MTDLVYLFFSQFLMVGALGLQSKLNRGVVNVHRIIKPYRKNNCKY